MSDSARQLAHEWAAAAGATRTPRPRRGVTGGLAVSVGRAELLVRRVVWSRSEIQTRVGVRLALLAVVGRVVTGGSARPAVASPGAVWKDRISRGAWPARAPGPRARADRRW